MNIRPIHCWQQLRSADQRHRNPTCTVNSLWLPQLPCVCVDQQFGTNFNRIREAQALRNSLHVGLRSDYLRVHMAGDTSDRRLTESVPYRWTYLLTKYRWMKLVLCHHKSALQLLLTGTDIQWCGGMKDATAFSKVEFTKEINASVNNDESTHSFQHKLPNQIV